MQVKDHDSGSPSAAPSPAPTARVAGYDVVMWGRKDLAKVVCDEVAEYRRAPAQWTPKLLFDLNGHALSLAARVAAYKRALLAADVLHADGGFLVTISKLQPGPSIEERSATTDFISDVAHE